MKNLKRIACLVLALALVCTLGITAMAASENPYTVARADVRADTFPANDVTNANNEEAIYALASLGVLVGYPDGTFKPGQVITRAEFSKIVYFFCGIKASDLPYWESLKTQFKDVKEGYWAEGYINFCAIEGYFKGYTDGTFKPEQNISMQEASTVLLRILGYTDDLKGTWPNDYNRKAVDIGLTDYFSFVGANAATRDVVAQMSYNILDCYKVQYVGGTAANTGYLANATGAILGSLVLEYQQALALLGMPDYAQNEITRRMLGYINMYQVDSEGYAYLFGKTNEGEYVYFDLLADAFGARKMDVYFADLNFLPYHKHFGAEMIESCGWHVTNAADGQLALDFYSNASQLALPLSVDLASRYYLVGGDLTDLGDSRGRIILSARGEAIFAATDGRTTMRANAAIPYTKIAGADYYDEYADAPFGIFTSVAEDRLGYATFNYVDVNGAAQAVTGLKKDLEPAYRFYNMTTGKFISYTELVKGDVLYNAGFVGSNTEDVTLILVYNPAKGILNQVTYDFGTIPGYVKIGETNYTYDADGTQQALLSLNGGATYAPMTYGNAATLMTTTEVSYVPAYNKTQLAVMKANTAAATTAPMGVVTGYTYGETWVQEGIYFVKYRTYAGVKILTPAGETATYEFTKPFEENTFVAGLLGDLVTLTVNSDGKAVSVDTPPPSFATNVFKFDPLGRPDGTIKVIGNRLTIKDTAAIDDIYTLADDAVIYMLKEGAVPGTFGSAKVVTAATFLATASYSFFQIDFKTAPDNNTIKLLYVVQAVPNAISAGIVTWAGEVGLKYMVYLLDGRQIELVNPADLPTLTVSSFIAFKLTEDNKMYEIKKLVWQHAPSQTTKENGNFAATMAGLTMETGTFDSIFTHSVITTTGAKTLFLNFDGATDKTVYFNFATATGAGAPCTIIDIVAQDEVPAATEVTYIYNAGTQTILYCFITNVTVTNP